MNTTTYEVLPTGNLDFSDIDGFKHLCFDKESIDSGYISKEQTFFVSAKLKNDCTKTVVFRIGIHGFASVMQFDRIKRQVLDRAS
jgi:hypothetical protein